MGRTQRPLDPAMGSISEFAAELRRLRAAAGEPKFSAMARNSSRSRTALTEAAGGDHLPTWNTVAAYVRACGGNLVEWESKWLAARDAMQNQPLMVTVAARAGATRRPRAHGRSSQSSPLPTSVESGLWPSGTSSAAKPALRLVVVQNKFAVGPTRVIEDTTPAYLSTKPQPYGRRLGFAVPDTDMWSAAVVPVACQVFGAYMVNYDVRDSYVQDNPHKAESTRWYWVVLPDGRAGYIAEIYVEPRFRGGLGLPTGAAGCAAQRPVQ